MPTVHPAWAVPGSRIVVEHPNLPIPVGGLPHVRLGSHDAQVVAASSRGLRVVVPMDIEGGPASIEIEGVGATDLSVEVARPLTTGVHQVDNPAFDGLGRVYVTQSGGPGTTVSVPLYRVSPDGAREPLGVKISNPTSLVLGPDGAMYVSSRFERTVYRLTTGERVDAYATDLGVPTGLAFSHDGSLFVGDRSGTVFRVSSDRQVEVFATLPPSVVAFHLAFGPDSCLYVSAPTLASRDPIYRITPDRRVDVVCEGFGRPQGLAFDSAGHLYVVEALAGSAGLYRVDVAASPSAPELVLTAPALVGVAFDPDGGMVVASTDTVWRLEVGLTSFLPALARRPGSDS